MSDTTISSPSPSASLLNVIDSQEPENPERSRARAQMENLFIEALHPVHGRAEGLSSKEDLIQVREENRIAADLGDLKASYYFAYMCQIGIGGPVELSKARKYYKTPAIKGHLDSLKFLSSLYFLGEGRKVIPGKKASIYELTDQVKARKYSKMGADQGDPRCLINYSFICYNGKGGGKDFFEARRCLKKAVDIYKTSTLQRKYGEMCLKREGSPLHRSLKRDLAEAKDYFEKAGDQGDLLAREKYREVKRKEEALKKEETTYLFTRYLDATCLFFD
jgi:TPR repeat protein